MSDVPPELKNGSEIPVFGMVLVTTAIFIATCNAILKVNPHTVRAQNLSGARCPILMPRQIRSPKRSRSANAPIKPSSSQIIVNIKSFCG